MPFDKEKYKGIFCYALIHLLNKNERAKLIRDCYDQLEDNGIMVFIMLSINDGRYGKGMKMGRNTYLTKHGITIYLYDPHSWEKKFGA